MRVTHLGHAGLKVETDSTIVLMDPWFSPEGAFQASWFQYPDNSHLLTPSLFQTSFVAISHEHMDHVDPWFLSRLNPDVPIVIHRYPSMALDRKILSAGPREIIAARAWEEVSLTEDTYVFFVPEESPVNHDAAMVVHSKGRTVLDLNDARLSPVQLREIRAKVGGTVDLFCLQGSGASWYPICYEFPKERRRELSQKKRLAKFGYVRRAIEALDPVTVLPFAGPPCFLDSELFHHNEEMDAGIFPVQRHVAEWLGANGISNTVVLMPGDAWDVDDRQKRADSYWSGFDEKDRSSYLERYAERRRSAVRDVVGRHPTPTTSMWDDFHAYFERLLGLNDYFNRAIDMRVGFEITGPGGGSWSVDFRAGLEGIRETIADCSYRYRFASRWLPPLLSGSVPWEDFFLSLRFQVARNPDLYNDHLLSLLKFAEEEPLKAVERFESGMMLEERIILRSEGRKYRVQRRCPHAGHDLLETGEILPGRVLRCLAHHYEFSLDTGKCINGMCSSLASELLEEH